VKAHLFPRAILALTCSMFSTSSNSEIFKCLIDGKAIYGQVPCPGSQTTVGEEIYKKEMKGIQAQEKANQAQADANEYQQKLRSSRETLRRYKENRSKYVEAAKRGDQDAAKILLLGDNLPLEIERLESIPRLQQENKELIRDLNESFERNKRLAARQVENKLIEAASRKRLVEIDINYSEEKEQHYKLFRERRAQFGDVSWLKNYEIETRSAIDSKYKKLRQAEFDRLAKELGLAK